MTTLLVLLSVLGIAIVFPYAIYPLLLRLVPGRPLATPPRAPQGETRETRGQPAEAPRVAVLIPAYNEAEHIDRKLRNTLALDWPAERLDVVVCSDGSTDDTAERAEAFAARGVRVLRNETNQGKAATINRLVAATDAPLLLMTDASADLERDVVERLTATMADPAVGVACARYVVRSGEEGHPTESGYWSFEAKIRRDEAVRDVLLGASGAAYMVRAELIEPLEEDTVNDDYVIPMRVRARGHRVAYVHDAVASDDPTAEPAALYHRWRRIAYGNYQMLWRHRGLFLSGRLFLPLLRKLLRTSGPLWLVAAVVLLLAGVTYDPRFELLGLGALSMTALGGISAVLPDRGFGRLRVLRVLRFATLSQLAYVVGAVRFAVGRAGAWRHEPARLDFDRPAPVPFGVRLLKRAFDIVASSVALVLCAPIMLLIAILVKLDSPGPVFYTQPRLCPGRDGRPTEFTMIKFRSMRPEAEAGTGPVWAGESDPRVTRLGAFMRKHRLDELPQFINILKGEMSLVGPRPERRFYVDQFEEKIPGYNDRHMVLRPGLTGWAQVQVGYDASTESVREKLAHDLAYVAHLYRVRTYLRMELRILIRTVRVVLTGKGAR